MKEEKKLNYYNETVDELYKKYNTNINGLSEEEAQKRLEQNGENGCRSKNNNEWFEIQANIAYYKEFLTNVHKKRCFEPIWNLPEILHNNSHRLTRYFYQILSVVPYC